MIGGLLASPLTLNDGRFDMDLDGLQDILTGDERIMLFVHRTTLAVVSGQNEIAVAAFMSATTSLSVTRCITIWLCRGSIISRYLAPDSPSTITLAAASKTFNIAGMETGSMLIADPDLRIQSFGNAVP